MPIRSVVWSWPRSTAASTRPHHRGDPQQPGLARWRLTGRLGGQPSGRPPAAKSGSARGRWSRVGDRDDRARRRGATGATCRCWRGTLARRDQPRRTASASVAVPARARRLLPELWLQAGSRRWRRAATAVARRCLDGAPFDRLEARDEGRRALSGRVPSGLRPVSRPGRGAACREPGASACRSRRC